MKLLISAKKGKLERHFSPSFSVDENHFEVTEESSLAIIGVNTTDLGLYYCGGQNKAHIQFREPITLKFPGGNEYIFLFRILAFVIIINLENVLEEGLGLKPINCKFIL